MSNGGNTFCGIPTLYKYTVSSVFDLSTSFNTIKVFSAHCTALAIISDCNRHQIFHIFCNCNHKQSILFRAVGTCPNLFWRKCKKKNVQVILFERDYPIFNTNLHELFCKLKIYDDLIIINLYSSFSI